MDIVVIEKHEKEIDKTKFFKEVLSFQDFSSDRLGQRNYFVTWLCGHLGIKESKDKIIQACRHPHSSVRNCACEALGKIGIDSSDVIVALERKLEDKYYRTRFHAAWSLGELRVKDSLKRLSSAIKMEEVLDVRKEMERVRNFLDSL